MIDSIKEYTKQGWTVHPLSGPKDTGNSPGKRPLLKGWQLLKKTPDLGAFPPGCNIGLVCGRVSDVMVIDYNDPLFIYDCFRDTWKSVLGSGRTSERGHIFFRYDPNLKSQKHHLLGIEILSDGSNAVLPPSVHVSGDIYRWRAPDVSVAEMDTIVRDRLLSLFNTEVELKQIMSKCRTCFKKVLKDYPANVPDVHGSDGRLFMLAICTDLVALGAKEKHLRMFSKLVYREKYDDQRTIEELKRIAPGKRWRCETLREKLPAYVNCTECVNHKFNNADMRETMKFTIPASVKELVLVIEK